MNFLESILYGFISGFSELTPVSAQAHQGLMLYLFGIDVRIPFLDFCVHIGMILGLLVSLRTLLSRLRRDRKVFERSHNKKNRRQVPKGIYDLRIIRTAALPMAVGLLFYWALRSVEHNLVLLSVFMLISGIVVILPEYIRHGNKDARSVSGLDSLGLGVSGALSAVPGISRIGTTMGYSLFRGADGQNAYNWALLLSIPAILIFTGFDIFQLASVGFGALSASTIIIALSACLFSFLGSCAAVSLMRYLMVNLSCSGFGYYSIGAALFTFIIYLIT